MPSLLSASRNHSALQALRFVYLSLCLWSTAQGKPKPWIPALGLGLEGGGARYIGKKQAHPTLALRGSLSLLKTVTRELGRGLPTSWVSVYGRLQNDLESDQVRSAVGVATGYLVFHGELGWTQLSRHSGPELLLGLGVVDIIGLYTRCAWLSHGQTIAELGLRVNYPLWVGQRW